MPKERKQRGRRKKKGEDADDESAVPEQQAQLEERPTSYNDGGEPDEQSANFFGLLDESEQTYFKTIDDAMIADEFNDFEERDIFVENVYKEAEGKELKLATSPLGSKVLEQLLARSKPAQVRQLFKHYQGNFHTLVRQRYASHVCEMLFAIAASLVSSEMSRPLPADADDSGEPYVSMENLFLYMFNEISGDLAGLGADVYASHVIRDVLLILQGTLFTFEEAKGQAKRYHGQKKFSWARPERNLSVPTSFKEALAGVIQTFSALPSVQLRMAASQPYSVSFVQVLLVIETERQAEGNRTILFNLLGGEALDERDDYMESILREPSGSKLFETIITSVPASHFRKFYETYFKERSARFAHNPITNFVVQKLIATCQDPEIIESIMAELSPVYRDLVDLNHMQVIQRLIEACIRLSFHERALFDQISASFECGPGSDRIQLISKILATPIAVSIEDADRPPRRPDAVLDPTSAGAADSDAGIRYNMQAVFLITTLFQIPAPESHAVLASSLLATPPSTLHAYAKSHAAVKILLAFFSAPGTSTLQRKQLLNAFAGHFVALANDAVGSHFVDACWSSTVTPGPLKLYKDRIAGELLAAADEVRGAYYGRLVWRNWHMDLFKHKRGEWQALVKQASHKQLALGRLEHGRRRDTAGPPLPLALPSTTTTTLNDTPSAQDGREGVHADRAGLIHNHPQTEPETKVQESRKDRKRRKKRPDASEDEVDDIFKKHRVR